MAFFSFSSNISLLNGMHELRKDMTSAHVDYILSQAFALGLSLSYHIPLIAAETKASAHAFCSKALFSSCLHCHSFAFGLAYSAFPGEE